jgi:hypothetical protein
VSRMLDLDTISFCATVCPPGIPMRDAQLVFTNLGKNRGLDEALQVTSIVMHNQRTSELDEQAVPPLRKALDSLVLSPVHPGALQSVQCLLHPAGSIASPHRDFAHTTSCVRGSQEGYGLESIKNVARRWFAVRAPHDFCASKVFEVWSQHTGQKPTRQ